MGVLSRYIARQEKVVEHLALAAVQIPLDKIMWKPCEKALPWLGLIHHTAIGRREVILKYLLGEPLNFPGCYFDPANHAKTPQEAVNAQRDSWKALRNFLSSQPGDYEHKKIVPFWGGDEMAIIDFLWMCYEENVHHRGQAWVYARMNGITPPSIWGTEV
jgi:hypothetical protein